MFQLSNFLGCIIHPEPLYNGRLNTYITWEAKVYYCEFFPKKAFPTPKNVPSTKNVNNNISDRAIFNLSANFFLLLEL